MELHDIANKDIYKRGIYHINNIINSHSTIARYMLRYNGIATKYLNEYLELLSYKFSKKLNDIGN